MSKLLNKTLSQIVTENYKTARIFENYGLDFCCKGRRVLQDVCDEKRIAVDVILPELYAAMETKDENADFNNMSLTELAEYIVRVHHSYVKLNMPRILNQILQVSTRHGDRFPYMSEVYLLFAELTQEMEQHMAKEENVLFPKIKLLELNASENSNAKYLNAPIHVMEQEHDHAGTIMQKIRELTGNYTPSDQVCTTFKVTLESLKAFEDDLHQHVHLENNILFPKTIQRFAKC